MYPVVSISELEKNGDVQLLRGSGISKKDFNDMGKFYCIHYGDLYTLYTPIIQDVLRKTNVEGKIKSLEGDVLVPATTTSDAMGIAIARALDKDGIIIGSDINIIRTRNNVLLSSYLSYMINFPLKRQLAQYAKGVNILHLNNNDIRMLRIPVPPIQKQKLIVEKTTTLFANIDKVKANAEQNLINTQELFKSALNKAFTENTESWEEKNLEEVCRKISAGGDKPDNFSKEITERYSIPIYSNGIENNGLYGYTDIPAITDEAITISARGTIGFICKRCIPYFPIVRLISVIPNDYININFMVHALNFMMPTGNGTSIPQLTVPMLKNKKIKYPSLSEQQKIVEKLDALQKQVKQLEQIYTQKIKECDELKQSVLNKAFKGEL